ncbi:hypothetical protein HPB48_025439 [Haemaphysalis longicornis]|uniref:CHHC U11-48K-type domain-containing protein n=1 Tax=Haemaphysalis longicornis TaxID=44386 RepID=A0A9J6H9J0_HAELO|nr:hypothetical protein HPB48_025439 [Haemaphysalis longicornis]
MSLTKRKTDLQNLKSLIQTSEKQLNAILESLKWSKDDVLKKTGYVMCPYDPGHTMPAASLNAHLDLCAYLREGYSRQEKEAAPPSSHFFYTNSTSVVPVLIDMETQTKIITNAALRGDVPAEVCQKVKSGVPLTMERCFSELTPPERFAIYDHVVERGKATNKTSSVRLEDLQVDFEKKPTADEQRPPSQLELKSQMRDYKRRRQSYRAKNVHITRKTYTELCLADGARNPFACPVGLRRETRPGGSLTLLTAAAGATGSRRSPEQQEHKKHHRSHHHKSKHKHKHKTKDVEDSR